MQELEPIRFPQNIEKEEKTYSQTYGKFIIAPIEPGFGTTIGNSLRRVLLSAVQGGAVRYVQVKGLLHQYTPIPGAREDFVELILNLKNLVIEISSTKEEELELDVEGPGKVTAGQIKCPPNVEIINKDLHLLELVDNGEFHMNLWVGNGRGYVREDEHPLDNRPAGVIPIDSIYSPVKKVNFTVDKERVEEKLTYEKLTIEIWTNGSITPEYALNLAAKILKDYFQSIMRFKEEPSYIERKKIDPALRNLQRLMNMKITELEVSVRCANCLHAAKIEYVKELVTKTEAELLRLRNFGKKSLEEVETILDRYGLHLGMDTKEIEKTLKEIESIEGKDET
ncbi:MAG: DNA-directed RNA polymerase subunit alpha [Candidatus Cloacimonadia bacterium]